MKTIALIDTNHGSGHHLSYMRRFCKTLLTEGYRVLVFYPQPDAVTEWLKEECPDDLSEYYPVEMEAWKRDKDPLFQRFPGSLLRMGRLPQPVTILLRWHYTKRQIEAAAQRIGYGPDLVFFNWLDNYLSYYLTPQWVDAIFPYSWSGLYFRPGDFRFGEKTFLGVNLEHSSVVKSKNCQAISVLNEDVIDLLSSRVQRPVIPFPDIIDNGVSDPSQYSLIADIQAKAKKRKIVGLLGALSKRKGILTLLEVAKQCQDQDYFFLFAGPLSKEMFHQDYDQVFSEEYSRVAKVDRTIDNCFFYFESLPEPLFNACIQTCDILFAAYENFPYSSNILTKAAFFKKPLMVTEGFCMGQRVEKFGMGVTIPEGDVAKCKEALEILSSEAKIQSAGLLLDFEGYYKLHSPEQLTWAFNAVFERFFGGK